MRLGKEGGSAAAIGSPFGRVTRQEDILSAIQAVFSCTPLFHDALCLDVVVPGIFRVPIKVIVTDSRLK
jgi:hypothetical protein